jgi:cytokinesis protein
VRGNPPLAFSCLKPPHSWLRSFIDLQGQLVLSNSLGNLNRNQQWREQDQPLEYEILKCLKTLLNSKYGAKEAVSHPKCVVHIGASLTSPSLPTRKTVCDILTFLSYWDAPHGHLIVLEGLDHLMRLRGELGRFDAWFSTFESTIDGRGRMGSLVGASEEIRSLRGKDIQAALAARDHQIDSALSEYAVGAAF